MNVDILQVLQKNQHGNLLLDVNAVNVVLMENAMLRNNQLTNCLLDYGIGKPKDLKSLCCRALWVRIPHLAYSNYKRCYYLDELSSLFKCYNVWQKIINNCGGNNDQ